jgi:hypothetical protein
MGRPRDAATSGGACARDYGVGTQAPRQTSHVGVQEVDVQVLELRRVACSNLQRVLVHVHAQLRPHKSR